MMMRRRSTHDLFPPSTRGRFCFFLASGMGPLRPPSLPSRAWTSLWGDRDCATCARRATRVGKVSGNPRRPCAVPHNAVPLPTLVSAAPMGEGRRGIRCSLGPLNPYVGEAGGPGVHSMTRPHSTVDTCVDVRLDSGAASAAMRQSRGRRLGHWFVEPSLGGTASGQTKTKDILRA